MPSIEGIHQPGLRRAGDAGDSGVVPANSIDNTELAQMAALSMKGNNTGIIANAADLSVAQIIALLGLGTAALSPTTAFDAAGLAAAAQAASQPLDSDLTALAALATTPYGRALLTLADQAALTAALADATSVLPGRLTAAEKLKLAALPVPIDSQTLVNQSTYTCPAFAANAYQKVSFEFSGKLTNNYIRFRFNNIAGSYLDHMVHNNTTVSADGSFYGSLNYARIGVASLPGGTFASFVLKFDFFPLTNGFQRQGLGSSQSANSAFSLNSTFHSSSAVALDDAVTDITFFTLFTGSAETFSGQMKVWGTPV